jgi:hypothetical protein
VHYHDAEAGAYPHFEKKRTTAQDTFQENSLERAQS